MLKSFKSVLTGHVDQGDRSISSEYQAVSVGDEADDEGIRRESSRRHERKVYYCFWALGAGVLLSWNGASVIRSVTWCSSHHVPLSAGRGGKRRTDDETIPAVLICTIPLLSSFFPLKSSVRTNLASYLSTIYCFGNLFFLGIAQRDVGKVCPPHPTTITTSMFQVPKGVRLKADVID